MVAFVFLVALFVVVVVARMVQDHRNSGIDDGWYGHSDYSTDRTASYLGPFS